jgi:hypothetical protein
LIEAGIDPYDFEKDVIFYNLSKERPPRALKNLLFLAGEDKRKKVNNARSRSIILKYIFDRDNQDLDYFAVNYKQKLRRLIRHALGKQDLHKVLNGDEKIFNKFIGKYNENAFPVLLHIFDKDISSGKTHTYFKKVSQYQALKQSAIDGNIQAFKKYAKGMPHRTVMGFRNFYKLDVDLSDVYKNAQLSTKDKIQMQSASKKAGAKVAVNYYKQDLYDLWKIYYHKVLTNDLTDTKEILDAITDQSARMEKIDIGKCCVIIDASESMIGSDERKFHPFLTALSIVSVLDNVDEVFIEGGMPIQKGPAGSLVLPSGSTKLWKPLLKIASKDVQNVIIISDGYENDLKGMFQHTYDFLKKKGVKLNLMHINPVLSTKAKSGTTRRLISDVDPMSVDNYKFLETKLIFDRMIEGSEIVKKLLIQKYTKLLGGA